MKKIVLKADVTIMINGEDITLTDILDSVALIENQINDLRPIYTKNKTVAVRVHFDGETIKEVIQ